MKRRKTVLRKVLWIDTRRAGTSVSERQPTLHVVNAIDQQVDEEEGMQDLMEALSMQIDPFREHLHQVGTIRQTLSTVDIEKLFQDIDAVQPLFHPLAEIAHHYCDYSAMGTAHHLADLVAKFEIEAVLLMEESGGGQKKTRKLLEQQRCVERQDEEVLNQIAELQAQMASLQQKMQSHPSGQRRSSTLTLLELATQESLSEGGEHAES